jgi:F-type H+-transporting ATPase subunit gamma
MPSIKEYDVKLKSLKNTQKMTQTMKMVSASKLRKAQDAQREAAEYARQLNALIKRLAASVEHASHPLLTRRPVGKALILVYTSDRGLCGGFNNNLIKAVRKWMEENPGEHSEISMSFAGRRGFSFFNNRASIVKHYEGITATPNFAEASHVGVEIAEAFLAGEYNDVYVAYNEFHSPLSQTTHIEKLLPVEPEIVEGGAGVSANYIFEPEQDKLLATLIPRAVYFRLYNALLENAAGEHGARMTAMDNATNNAGDLIRNTTLLRNRARQAAITTELTEIVAGAEAV